MIASATTASFETHFRPHGAFLRRFEVIKVPETDNAETAKIVGCQVAGFCGHYRIRVPDDLVPKLITVCERYLPTSRFPTKAINTLDAAMQHRRMTGPVEEAKATDSNALRMDDILAVISSETGIPVSRLGVDEKEKLNALEKNLGMRVFDQDKAVHSLADAIRNVRLGLGDPKKAKAIALNKIPLVLLT